MFIPLLKTSPAIASVIAVCLIVMTGCDLQHALTPVRTMRTDTVLTLRNPSLIKRDSPYVPEQLDAAANSEVFVRHAERAMQRRRKLTGSKEDPERLFDKVVAAADYVANLAKHPHRHEMGLSHSDPRAEPLLGEPEQLALLAEENQVWTGVEWVPAPGTSITDVAPLECTYQHLILGGIVNVLGAQWRLVVHEAHTSFAYYDFEIGKWIYIESTFNEHYRLRSSTPNSYIPLSPEELRRLSLEGRTSEIVAVRHPYQPQRFGQDSPYYLRSYVEAAPSGWAPMAVTLSGMSVSKPPPIGNIRVLPGAESEAYFHDQVRGGWALDEDPTTIWAPEGETFLLNLQRVGETTFAIELETNLAVTDPIFERHFVSRRGWTPIEKIDTLSFTRETEVHIRACSSQYVSGKVILKPIHQ